MLDTAPVATLPKVSSQKTNIRKADLLKELAQYAKPSNSRGLLLAAHAGMLDETDTGTVRLVRDAASDATMTTPARFMKRR